MTVAVQQQKPIINLGLVKAHLVAGVVFLIVAMLMGIFYALQFNNLYPFPGIEFLSPGRIRMIHTNGVAYGFIVNAFLGALYWAVPRLTKSKVLSDRLGWLIFWVYSFILVWTVVGILAGHGQAAVGFGQAAVGEPFGIAVFAARRDPATADSRVPRLVRPCDLAHRGPPRARSRQASASARICSICLAVFFLRVRFGFGCIARHRLHVTLRQSRTWWTSTFWK